jgi:predicted dienelactone hydrolase
LKLLRSSRSRHLFVALAVAGLLASCGSAASTSTSTPTSGTAVDTAGSAPVAVTAADQVGPYKVGRRSVTLDDAATGRKVDADIWYPVSPAVEGSPTRYSFLPTIYYDSKVALDAPPVAPGEAFPLVVYSHGSGGFRWVATFFTETLASHGFVVVSADHAGDTATDQIVGSDIPVAQNAVNRVETADFLIDSMLAMNTTVGGPFEHTINPDEIGTTGHSFGGFTAIGAVTGYSNPLGTVPPDPRIKAVAVMAAYTAPLDDATLATLQVPTMLVSGTRDTTAPIRPMTDRVWDLAPGRPMYRVDITDAGHQSFSDVCFFQRQLPTIADVPKVITDVVDSQAVSGCGPGILDIYRAQQIIDTFTISFLETELAHVAGYDTVLTPEGAAAYPEVAFSSKMS